MGRAIIWAITCALTGCGLHSAKGIDAGSNLDCGMLFLHAEKNQDIYNATEMERRALYILRSWYFTKIREDQSADDQAVVISIKSNPASVAPALHECTDRAMKDPAFERWASFASKEYRRPSR